MKTVASKPAFEVVDLELEVLNLNAPILAEGGFRFCVSKETERHGNLYPEVRPGCVAYYAAEYNQDPVAAVERATALGHELYWINNVGASITSHDRPQYTLFLLKPGQLVEMNGQRLKVVDQGRGYWGFEIVKAEDVAA